MFLGWVFFKVYRERGIKWRGMGRLSKQFGFFEVGFQKVQTLIFCKFLEEMINQIICRIQKRVEFIRGQNGFCGSIFCLSFCFVFFYNVVLRVDWGITQIGFNNVRFCIGSVCLVNYFGERGFYYLKEVCLETCRLFLDLNQVVFFVFYFLFILLDLYYFL